MPDSESRIFVDEDWKARVQREKEEARLRAEGQPKPDASVAAAAPPADAEDAGQAHPAFEAMVSTLATQVMFSLGFLAAPGQDQVMVNLEHAREGIEMMIMFRDKTKGNLAPAEERLLTDTLAEMQRLFAARMQQAQAQMMRNAGVNPNALKTPPAG